MESEILQRPFPIVDARLVFLHLQQMRSLSGEHKKSFKVGAQCAPIWRLYYSFEGYSTVLTYFKMCDETLIRKIYDSTMYGKFRHSIDLEASL